MITRSTLLWLLLMVPAMPIVAAEPEPAPEPAAEAADAQATAGDDAAAPADATDPILNEAATSTGSTTTAQDDTFVPSVQISEDLSVSFPIDI